MNSNQDAEHLRLLSIFHYVHAAIVAFYSLFAMLYIVLGLLMLTTPLLMGDAHRSARHRDVHASDQQETTDAQASSSEEVPANEKASADDQLPSNGPANVKEIPRADAFEFDSDRHGRPVKSEPSPVFIGVIAICFGVVGLLIGLTYASVQVLVGRFITRKKHRMFCMIVSVLNCMNIPMGLVLGVFTLIVLARPSVKPLFDKQPTLDTKAVNG